jgi:hypothetical protein
MPMESFDADAQAQFLKDLATAYQIAYAALSIETGDGGGGGSAVAGTTLDNGSPGTIVPVDMVLCGAESASTIGRVSGAACAPDVSVATALSQGAVSRTLVQPSGTLLANSPDSLDDGRRVSIATVLIVIAVFAAVGLLLAVSCLSWLGVVRRRRAKHAMGGPLTQMLGDSGGGSHSVDSSGIPELDRESSSVRVLPPTATSSAQSSADLATAEREREVV